MWTILMQGIFQSRGHKQYGNLWCISEIAKGTQVSHE